MKSKMMTWKLATLVTAPAASLSQSYMTWYPRCYIKISFKEWLIMHSYRTIWWDLRTVSLWLHTDRLFTAETVRTEGKLICSESHPCPHH